MASFTDKKLSEVYKDILHTDNSNTGIGATTKQIKCGDGDATVLYLSSRHLALLPDADSTTLIRARAANGDTLLQVDSTNSLVKIGVGSHIANTQFKEFGLHDFSPTQGYHNPMVCNNMMFSDSGDDIIADDSMFGNGSDRARTLDLSADGTASSLVACTCYVQSNITIDEVRVIGTCNSSNDLNFHLYSYNINTSTGDLSDGTLLAHVGSSMSATNTAMKTDTLTIDSADVNADRAIYAFVENEGGTGDVTCQLVVKYHLR